MRMLVPLLALLAAPSFVGAAEDNAPRSPSHHGLWTMLCTQEGVAKGHRNKELDAFVGACVKARKSAGDGKLPGDATEPRDVPEMANC